MAEIKSGIGKRRATANLDRLRSDLDALNEIGRINGLKGINRLSFSTADMEGRRWMMQRMEEAGLSVHMDPVGNVFGRWDVGSGAPVMAGSHLDTVLEGGPLDGTLGVCAALEAVRAMKEAGIEPERPVVVVGTADEEGRFGGMLGSQAICGEVDRAWIEAAVDDDGKRLVDAMRGQGLDPDGLDDAAWGGIQAFLELHIEQGPVLTRSGEPIGIVNAVSGVFNWIVTLTGEANHSGTTPMDHRRDAFRGLADFGASIADLIAGADGPETRMTVGKVTLSPNFPHSVPGKAVFSIIGRDINEAGMHNLAALCRERLKIIAKSHGLDLEIAEQSWLPPTPLSPALRDRLSELSRDLGYRTRVMSSGAGHDAQTFARHFPAGLIFVPSVGGISHAPEEWTDWSDIGAGVNLLTEAIVELSVGH